MISAANNQYYNNFYHNFIRCPCESLPYHFKRYLKIFETPELKRKIRVGILTARKTMYVRINVTMRRGSVTIVAVENQ